MVSIIQGSDQPIQVQLFIEEGECSTKKFFDITGASEIVAKFLNADGTLLEQELTNAKIVINDALSGLLTIVFEESETQALKIGDCESMEMTITIGTKTYIYQFKEEIKVIGSLFC
jgi:hypothetical protein